MEYCEKCDYDMHVCMGCGCPTTHEGQLSNPSQHDTEWHNNYCIPKKDKANETSE